MVLLLLLLREVLQGVSSESCIGILTNPLSSQSLAVLKNSGKGGNEVGHYGSCLSQGMQYLILQQLSDGSSDIIKVGVCLPKECSNSELNQALNPQGWAIYAPEEASLSFYGLCYLAALLVFISLSLISTFLHYYSEEYSKNRFVQAFSTIIAYRNLMKIRENNKFGCINGLRVISFAWVIYGHCFAMKLASPIINFEHLQELYFHWWTTLGYGGFYAVDIFFWITGFLLSYFLLLELEKKRGRINWAALYIHRTLRIIPTYAVLIGFTYFILPTLNGGPAWHNAAAILKEDCADYWWTNFLFLNNFIPDGDGNACFGIGWYLANDMQFFLFGPLFVFMYFKISRKMLFWFFCLGLLILQFFLAYSIAFHYNLKVNIMDSSNKNEGEDVWFNLFYTKPYIRCSPYILGILTGILYLCYTKVSDKTQEKNEDEVSQWLVEVVIHKKWVGRACILIGIIGMLYFIVVQQAVYIDLYNPNVWSREKNAFFLAFLRTGFIISMILFLMPIMMKQAPLFELILANSALEPLAKISYSGFLVHFGIFISYYSSQNNTLLGGIYALKEMLSLFPISTFFGFLVYLFIEVPFQNLEKLLFSIGR